MSNLLELFLPLAMERERASAQKAKDAEQDAEEGTGSAMELKSGLYEGGPGPGGLETGTGLYKIYEEGIDVTSRPVQLAIVGRPNVGKVRREVAEW